MDCVGPMRSSRDGQYYARIDYSARFAAAPGPNPVKSDIRILDNHQQNRMRFRSFASIKICQRTGLQFRQFSFVYDRLS